jgi:hypothetical protein
MDPLQNILSWKIKPKEKVTKITELIIDRPELMQTLIINFRQGKITEKGTYATVLKHVSEHKPTLIEPYIDELIAYINHSSNRVKWGIPETIGNLAEQYPKKVSLAIPKLMLNTQDPSTVVRWCAAYALSRIMIHNPENLELRKHLEEVASEEVNNGVKNVYLKALKSLQK